MRRDALLRGVFALLIAAAAWACDDGTSASGPDAAGAGGMGGGAGGMGGGAGGMGGGAGGQGGDTPRPDAGPPDGEAVFASKRANLRFKRAYRLQREFARVLDLPADQLCAELGRYDCIDDIHTITLGGVEPYVANIYQPFEATSVSAPLVVERVALAGCVQRADLDAAAGANAVLFAGLTPNGSVEADGPEIDAWVEALYTRALLRMPTDDERAGYRDLYREVLGSDVTARPARDFAVLACMATLTSVESLFY